MFGQGAATIDHVSCRNDARTLVKNRLCKPAPLRLGRKRNGVVRAGHGGWDPIMADVALAAETTDRASRHNSRSWVKHVFVQSITCVTKK